MSALHTCYDRVVVWCNPWEEDAAGCCLGQGQKGALEFLIVPYFHPVRNFTDEKKSGF